MLPLGEESSGAECTAETDHGRLSNDYVAADTGKPGPQTQLWPCGTLLSAPVNAKFCMDPMHALLYGIVSWSALGIVCTGCPLRCRFSLSLVQFCNA